MYDVKFAGRSPSRIVSPVIDLHRAESYRSTVPDEDRSMQEADAADMKDGSRQALK